jgi:SAM-dependent methyltransferase
MLDFLGIGAQKAGTTWLYAQLSAHPQVRFPAGKELHFWNNEEERDVAQYKRRFDQPIGGDTRNGEITPAYAILSRERVAEIRSHFPSLRLLYLIRNPIERAWSSALMALSLAEMQIDEASDQWFIDHFRSRGSLRRGDYEACIRTWTSVYPKEQLLIARYEAIQEEPRDLLKSVATHLGIDAGFFSSVSEDTLNRRIFGGSAHPLRPSLRAVLERLYGEKVQSLSAYLGMDLGWTPLIRPSAGALLKGNIRLKKRTPNPFEKFANLSDTDWLALMMRSIKEPIIQGVSFPAFPDRAIQESTVGCSYEHALHEAFSFYSYTKEILQRLNLPFNDWFRMIDFGVAWGRITRFFLRDLMPGNIVGLDADDTYIELAKAIALPVDLRVVSPLGPTNLPSESFSLVTAYSVFSHLDQEAADAWANEFARVLRPGGVLVATTEGEPFIDFCTGLAGQTHFDSEWHRTLSTAFAEPERARRRYLSGEFVATKSYPNLPHYGEALIPLGYIARNWGDRFELLEFREAGQYFWQAVFVLRKRSRPLQDVL